MQFTQERQTSPCGFSISDSFIVKWGLRRSNTATIQKPSAESLKFSRVNVAMHKF